MLAAVDLTFENLSKNLENISANGGYEVTITGMAIVFVVLSLIAIAITLLPRILEALAPYLPAEIEHHHHAPASTPAASGDTDPAVVVAIASVLHTEMQSRAGQS